MSDNHILRNLEAGIRFDGRKLLDYRKIEITFDVSGNAEGAARVKFGDTEVLAGVKVEMGKPYPDIPEEGTLMVGAELLPMSNPEFESGPPQIQAIELARVVDRGIRESKCVDFKSLCITKGEKVWTLCLDLAPMNDDGNLLDAFGLAGLAALKVMKFPKVDGDKIDYHTRTDKGVELRNLPIPITVCKIGKYFLVDPTNEEEPAIEARLTVTSLGDGNLCALQKGGDKPLTSEDISRMVDIAIEKGKELRGVFESATKRR